MPTPITPQVPQSRRLRGMRMSITLRVMSRVFAPSLSQINLRFVGEHAFDGAERAVEIHWVGVGLRDGSPCARYSSACAGSARSSHAARRPDLTRFELRQQGRDGRGDVPDDWRSDRTIAVHLRRRDVQLNELRRRRPLRALTVA